MRLNKYLLIIFALITATVCIGGYISANNNNLFQNQNNKTKTDTNERIPDVTFTCNHSTLCKIEKEKIQARILRNKTDKPDNIHPRCLSFKFIGEYGEQSQASKFKPKINIYNISEFRQSLSISTEYVEQFDEQLNELRQLITEQPLATNNELPFLPFIDSNKEFNIHLKYISFKNGKGLFYLTQFNTEPSIINNEGLTYVFQGITDNNEYYILATFPVKAKILPDGYDAEEFEDYELPLNFYKQNEYKQNEINYNNYILKMKNTLDSLDSDQFNPSLKFFEDILTSLKVK